MPLYHLIININENESNLKLNYIKFMIKPDILIKHIFLEESSIFIIKHTLWAHNM